jgi:hypothetical protein
MRISKTAILSIVSLLAIQAASHGQTIGGATIRGSITATDGTAINGAVITYRRIADTRLVTSGFQMKLEIVPGTGASGVVSTVGSSYRIDNLPAGNYILCVKVLTGGYLDPCQWSGSPSLRLPVGVTSATKDILVQRGASVVVHVSDLAKKIRSGVQPGSPVNLIVGIYRGTEFIAATSTASVFGRDFSPSVPLNNQLQLWIHSRDLTIGTATGQNIDVANGYKTPLPLLSGAQPVEFTFVVR